MPSISAIARDWHVSRPYVSRMVNQRGCPTSSLQDAHEWRECYASKRLPIARRIEDPEDRNTPLIPFATAKDMAWRGYDEILHLVLELPQRIATQCNPSNPKLAFNVLESQCTEILCAACDVDAAWSEGGPQITTATDAE